MKRALVTLITVAVTVTATPALSQPAGARPLGWQTPRCDTVTGDGSVTYTRDEGATLTPTTGRTEPTLYTYGLVALDTPNTLLATPNGVLERSTDAGCTWTVVGDLATRLFVRLTPARGGVAYAWQENGGVLQRIQGDRIGKSSPPPSVDPVTGVGIAGLAVDRWNADHVRSGTSEGQVWDSRDGGQTWTAVGRPAYGDLFAYTVAFDPNDLDHVLTGWVSHGAAFTWDGGRSWRAATGLAADGTGPVNVFSIAVSPVAPAVVFAEGLDLHEFDQNTPTEGRHVYRSVDGGRGFVPVATNNVDGVRLTNGILMAPHPLNPAVLYFEFGMAFGGYGTDLFRYDAMTGRVTLTHNSYDSISAIAFNPVDPRVMYVGLVDEPGGGIATP